MIIEGVDDSVSIPFSLLLVIFTFIMLNYLRDKILVINQINPTLHRDAFEEIAGLRNRFTNIFSGNNNNRNDGQQSTDEYTLRLSNNNANSNQNRATNNITCPVCLGQAVLAVETNCKHCFCSTCIIQYWKHSTNNVLMNKMNCPMCRNPVICLLPLYSIVAQRRISSENNELFDLINTYNRRFSGLPRPLLDQLFEIPLLLRHVINELFTFDNIEFWFRLRFGFMFLISFMYFLSPLDIIPEALFGLFGYLDDIMVFVVMAFYICTIYRQVISQRT